MEPQLRARLRAGDPDAFGVLFDQNARAVYNLGFRLTANWSAAEDVVSLTFLEAWRLRSRIDPGSEPLRPWLLGIALNVSRNLARASRRHEAALSRLPPPPLVPDFADEVAGRLDDQAQLREAGKALSALSRGEREVIALCVWSELDYASAARALGVPVGTVRSRLSRARRKLQKLVPAGREPSARAGPEPSVRAGQESSVRAGQESSVRAGQEPSVLGGQESSVLGGQEPSVRAGREPSVRAGREPSGGCEQVMGDRECRGPASTGGAR